MDSILDNLCLRMSALSLEEKLSHSVSIINARHVKDGFILPSSINWAKRELSYRELDDLLLSVLTYKKDLIITSRQLRAHSDPPVKYGALSELSTWRLRRGFSMSDTIFRNICFHSILIVLRTDIMLLHKDASLLRSWKNVIKEELPRNVDDVSIVVI